MLNSDVYLILSNDTVQHTQNYYVATAYAMRT